MEYWLAWFHETNDGAEVKAIAKAAEELGFTGIALSDHVALPKVQQSLHPIQGIPYNPLTPNIEPITTAATMAAVTVELKFLTYAYVMGMRDPFTVAKQAAALADLTDNRFALGITPGWSKDEIALLGHDPATRGKRFTESIDVMQGLWNNDLFSYDGVHYNFTDVGISPRPKIPPKIFIGGNSPVAIKRAAKNAGWIGMHHPLDELKPLLASLDDLSDNQAAKYIIAVNGLSDKFLAQVESLGIDGLVLMPWAGAKQMPVSLDDKLQAMRNIAQFRLK
jgi:probable F420-dependent oxidoreductase